MNESASVTNDIERVVKHAAVVIQSFLAALHDAKNVIQQHGTVPDADVACATPVTLASLCIIFPGCSSGYCPIAGFDSTVSGLSTDCHRTWSALFA